MLKSALLVVLIGVSLTQSADRPHPLAGEWEGSYATSRSEGRMWLKVDRANGEWSVALKVTYADVENPTFQPTSSVTVDGNTISFVAQWGGPVEFKGTLEGDVLKGQMAAEYWSTPGTWSTRRPSAGADAP